MINYELVEFEVFTKFVVRSDMRFEAVNVLRNVEVVNDEVDFTATRIWKDEDAFLEFEETELFKFTAE